MITGAEALGVVQLNLSGGEPLLRKDLEQLVEAAARLQLYTNLITSGLPLERALTALSDEAEDPKQRELVAHLRSEVNAGSPFARALASAPREFDEVYRGVVAAGEQSLDGLALSRTEIGVAEDARQQRTQGARVLARRRALGRSLTCCDQPGVH